ncbi:MAG: DUF488 family protein [Pirellulales bacterium]
MLKRQKLILALLREAEEPLTSTRFVKLIFLMRKQAPFCDDPTFYDFVPYKFGPFSFALYRELSALQRDGYIAPDENSISLNNKTRSLTTTAIAELSPHFSDAVRSVVRQYGGLSQKALLRKVYSEHPWYATKSELSDLVPDKLPTLRPAPVAVYTVGYEGKSVDAFFDHLLRSGIQALIDVRANPVSRKYGFAAKSLREIGTKVGLAYWHLPELGIEGTERTTLTSVAAYHKLLDRYQSEMLPRRRASIKRLAELLGECPSALMCVERDVQCCHRSRLATAVAKVSGLPVVHL